MHLKAYGMVKVFKVVTANGDIEYWLTSDLQMTRVEREGLAVQAWSIEEYHRGLKQHCGVERCQAQRAVAQRNHIGYSIRAFLRLELRRLREGFSWFESKLAIVRPAVAAYLAAPRYNIAPAT